MKKVTIIQIVVALLLVTRGLAGTLTVNGSLTISTNITAQSITLGGVTETNWPSGPNGGVIDLTSGQIDFSQTGLLYRFTLTNNVNWMFTNHVAGRLVFLQITENATGGWTNAWPTGVLWPNGGFPISGNVSSNALSVYQILDNGTSWLTQAEGLNYQTNNSGYALLFDGSQNYVGVAAFANNATSSRTVEWWAKSTGTGGGFYIGSWQSTVSQYNFLCVNNVAASEWYVQTAGGNVILGSVPTEASDGAWHHYALVETPPGTVNIYIDGTNRGYGSASLSMGGLADLEIGNIENGGGGYDYSGTIDEVRISSVARYTTTFTPAYSFTLDSDTVGYWKFNEGSGSTTADATGNHNGLLLGSPPPTWVGGR
jgi:hypothetical protein